MTEKMYHVVSTEHAQHGYGLITVEAYKRQKWTCTKMPLGDKILEGNYEDALKEKKRLVKIVLNS